MWESMGNFHHGEGSRTGRSEGRGKLTVAAFAVAGVGGDVLCKGNTKQGKENEELQQAAGDRLRAPEKAARDGPTRAWQ